MRLFLHDVSIFWLEHLYILSKLQIPALKVHVLWCRTLIYRWKLSEKVSLMFEDSFPIPLLCSLKYISLYLSIIAWEASTIFLKLIPGVLARSVNFEIPKKFLCRRPVFPVNLSVSYDYGLKNQYLLFQCFITADKFNKFKGLSLRIKTACCAHEVMSKSQEWRKWWSYVVS